MLEIPAVKDFVWEAGGLDSVWIRDEKALDAGKDIAECILSTGALIWNWLHIVVGFAKCVSFD